MAPRPITAGSTVYGGGGGVGPIEVPDGGGRTFRLRRPIIIAREGVRGVGRFYGPATRRDRGRVEVVLRSDVGGAGATSRGSGGGGDGFSGKVPLHLWLAVNCGNFDGFTVMTIGLPEQPSLGISSPWVERSLTLSP